MVINGQKFIGKEYFDQDYFETPGYKSGYDKRNLSRGSYLNKAIAVWITQTLKFGGTERILEIGCAYGWVVEWMVKQYGFDAYGQDISAYTTKNAPTEIQHRIRECESIEIAFDGKFDLVYSIETFEHVPKPLVDKYFKNIYNCLNDNGILFCTICLGHNDNRGADIDQSHQTLQPRDWWNSKLEEAGFIIRKDLEAEAYELGLQTPEMSRGAWLPREFNWHVFVAQKTEKSNLSDEITRIYDRRLLVNNRRKNGISMPKLLVIGSRGGCFEYPTNDFFQIDNWGNYLSYFFDAEFHSIRDGIGANIIWDNYDLIIAALDYSVVRELTALDNITCKRGIAFLDGTLSMISERLEHRENLLRLLDKFTIICAHEPGAEIFTEVFGKNALRCSHIFPFRFFDHYFHKNEELTQFNILCAGFFNSTSSLSSFSLFLASKFADKVYMATQFDDPKIYNIPSNCELFRALPQEMLYSQILPKISLVLKMDNPAGVGRIIAEAAAAKIPTIASKDLFEMRCYPELMVESIEDLNSIICNIERIRMDPEWRIQLGDLARGRLISSNESEFNTMLRILHTLEFDVKRPKELYW